MNFLYTDLPMTHVLRLDPYSNPAISRAFLPKDVNNNLAEAAIQATEAVLTYRAPQKYEEPELSSVTGGLNHSQWTADLVLSKSSMARAGPVILEVGTEAEEDLDGSDVQDVIDEPIRITVVREHMKRQPRQVEDDKAILTDQYLNVWRRKSLAGYKVSDMYYCRRDSLIPY